MSPVSNTKTFYDKLNMQSFLMDRSWKSAFTWRCPKFLLFQEVLNSSTSFQNPIVLKLFVFL